MSVITPSVESNSVSFSPSISISLINTSVIIRNFSSEVILRSCPVLKYLRQLHLQFLAFCWQTFPFLGFSFYFLLKLAHLDIFKAKKTVICWFDLEIIWNYLILLPYIRKFKNVLRRDWILSLQRLDFEFHNPLEADLGLLKYPRWSALW